FSKSTLTGENEDQQSELEYLALIRRIRDEEPQVFERIKRLPKKARAARIAAVGDPAPSLATYVRKGPLEKFFIAESSGGTRELDFFAMVRLLMCDADTPGARTGNDFYPLLDRNKAAFNAVTAEEGDVPRGRGRDSGAKLLNR